MTEDSPHGPPEEGSQTEATQQQHAAGLRSYLQRQLSGDLSFEEMALVYRSRRGSVSHFITVQATRDGLDHRKDPLETPPRKPPHDPP